MGSSAVSIPAADFVPTMHIAHKISPSPPLRLSTHASVQIEAAALGRIMLALDKNQPARSVALSDEEAVVIRPLYLLTMKPMIYAANVAEDDLADLGAANKHVQTMRNKIAKDGCELIIVSAQVRGKQQPHSIGAAWP